MKILFFSSLICLLITTDSTTIEKTTVEKPYEETIYHWSISADRESPIAITHLHKGDSYLITEAKGIATFAKPNTPWWRDYLITPAVHIGKGVASYYCGHSACGKAVEIAGKFIPKFTNKNKKPRPADNVPIDPHRKEGGVYTIDPSNNKVWAYQHIAADNSGQAYTSPSTGSLMIKVHDQAGKFKDNEGLYYGSITVWCNH